MANEFGEDGREYYHAVSQYHPKYNQRQTDGRFDYCLRKRYNYGIGTFFYHCSVFGITINEDISKTFRSKNGTGTAENSEKSSSKESSDPESIRLAKEVQPRLLSKEEKLKLMKEKNPELEMFISVFDAV